MIATALNAVKIMTTFIRVLSDSFTQGGSHIPDRLHCIGIWLILIFR